MAEKKAKTAQKSADKVARARACPNCGADSRVTYFTGYGRKGFFWVCEKECGFSERTR
ncbi:MAG: hypothetical protein HY699_14505 [Deltaproteobacteria bacterium]|nr:hypothetical protein [Deltaproteobacteria bacterium]